MTDTTVTKKITDTIDAKLISIIEDHYEHDADTSAECAQDIKALFSSRLKEIEEKVRGRKTVHEMDCEIVLWKEIRCTCGANTHNAAIDDVLTIIAKEREGL